MPNRVIPCHNSVTERRLRGPTQSLPLLQHRTGEQIKCGLRGSYTNTFNLLIYRCRVHLEWDMPKNPFNCHFCSSHLLVHMFLFYLLRVNIWRSERVILGLTI